MLKYGSAGMLLLAGLAALFPWPMAWAYVGAFMVFELWLARQFRSAGTVPPPVGEPPYLFDADESRLVGRYRYYFTFPLVARDAGSVLAATGLSALVLSPWLVFRHEMVPGILVAANLLAVAAFTKRLAPLMVLRISANKGDRDSLRLLEAHETAWQKIRAANVKEK